MSNVIIAGMGQVGTSIALALSKEGHNITMIEQDGRVIDSAENLDALVIKGNAASPIVLEGAYISSADFFIGATGSDEVNMLAAAMAKSKGCKTIVRINGLDYMNEPVTTTKFKEIGIDVAICPEITAAIQMSNILTASTLLDSDVFGGSDIHVLETLVDPGAKAVNKLIKDVELPKDCNIGLIFRDEEVLIPHSGEKFVENDRVLFVLGDTASRKTIEKLFGEQSKVVEKERKIEKVMIYGASRIGVHLAQNLYKKGLTIVMLEEDEALCRMVSERLPKILVINGSGSNLDTLQQEGVEEVDAFLATTTKEEINILSCLLAKQAGAKKVISLVDKLELKGLLERIGMDLVISPRSMAVSAMLRYTHAEDLLSLKVMGGGDADVLEEHVHKNARIVGTKLSDLSEFKKGALVAAAVRDGKVIIPRGDFVFQTDDRLIIFTKSDKISKLEQLFKKG